MNENDDSKLLGRLELYLNEQRADVAFMRLLLKKFLLRIVTGPNPALAEERLRDLKNDAMATLDRPPPVPRGPDENRFHELTKFRTEEFFRELEELLAEARNISGESGRH